jgi:mitotic spindle assembly checkpoint protein MAD2B
MPQPPPPPTPLLNTQKSLLITLTDFLTVAFHTILYCRSLYPSSTFLTTRKYNFPVHQNRHPAVCTWINNTISHIHKLLESNSVSRVVFVIFSIKGEVLERYLFDLERFPIVGKAELWVEFEDRHDKGKEPERGDDLDEGQQATVAEHPRKDVNLVDIEEQLRATISKLDFEAGRKGELPKGCTYTVAVELREEPKAVPPIGVSPFLHSKIMTENAQKLHSIPNLGFLLFLHCRLEKKARAKPSAQTWEA